MGVQAQVSKVLVVVAGVQVHVQVSKALVVAGVQKQEKG